MSDVQKYESEFGMMQPSGVGQYVRLYDYRTLEGETDKLRKKCEVLSEALKEAKRISESMIESSQNNCCPYYSLDDIESLSKKTLAQVETMIEQLNKGE